MRLKNGKLTSKAIVFEIVADSNNEGTLDNIKQRISIWYMLDLDSLYTVYACQ